MHTIKEHFINYESKGRRFESSLAHHQTESGRNSRSDSFLLGDLVLAFIACIFYDLTFQRQCAAAITRISHPWGAFRFVPALLFRMLYDFLRLLKKEHTPHRYGYNR